MSNSPGFWESAIAGGPANDPTKPVSSTETDPNYVAPPTKPATSQIMIDTEGVPVHVPVERVSEFVKKGYQSGTLLVDSEGQHVVAPTATADSYLSKGYRTPSNVEAARTMEPVNTITGTKNTGLTSTRGLEIGTGAVKAGMETAHTLGAFYRYINPPEPGSIADKQLPNEFKQPDYLNSQSHIEAVGKLAENVAEFFAMDGAMKGLSLSEKIGATAKIASIAEKYPPISYLLNLGMDSARMGAAQGAVSLIHNPTEPTEAVKQAGFTALGTMAIGSLGLGFKKWADFAGELSNTTPFAVRETLADAGRAAAEKTSGIQLDPYGNIQEGIKGMEEYQSQFLAANANIGNAPIDPAAQSAFWDIHNTIDGNLDAMRGLRDAIESNLKPSPSYLVQKGYIDPGFIDGQGFKQSIFDLVHNGTLAKAYSPEEIGGIQHLAEQVANTENMKLLYETLRSPLGKALGLGGAAAGILGTAIFAPQHLTGVVGTEGGAFALSCLLGWTMRNPEAAEKLANVLRVATTPDEVATGIRNSIYDTESKATAGGWQRGSPARVGEITDTGEVVPSMARKSEALMANSAGQEAPALQGRLTTQATNTPATHTFNPETKSIEANPNVTLSQTPPNEEFDLTKEANKVGDLQEWETGKRPVENTNLANAASPAPRTSNMEPGPALTGQATKPTEFNKTLSGVRQTGSPLARRILNEQLKGIEDHPEQILNIKPTEATKQAINALKRSYLADLFNSNDEMQVLVAKALKDVVKK